ncbi:MAG TPA: hypothetical protein VJ890_24965 [Vineibacter sp.]|nr:hypothetical protein [Vineibacter sp.]
MSIEEARTTLREIETTLPELEKLTAMLNLLQVASRIPELDIGKVLQLLEPLAGHDRRIAEAIALLRPWVRPDLGGTVDTTDSGKPQDLPAYLTDAHEAAAGVYADLVVLVQQAQRQLG